MGVLTQGQPILSQAARVVEQVLSRLQLSNIKAVTGGIDSAT